MSDFATGNKGRSNATQKKRMKQGKALSRHESTIAASNLARASGFIVIDVTELFLSCGSNFVMWVQLYHVGPILSRGSNFV